MICKFKQNESPSWSTAMWGERDAQWVAKVLSARIHGKRCWNKQLHLPPPPPPCKPPALKHHVDEPTDSTEQRNHSLELMLWGIMDILH